jgi:hypothetical protein
MHGATVALQLLKKNLRGDEISGTPGNANPRRIAKKRGRPAASFSSVTDELSGN